MTNKGPFLPGDIVAYVDRFDYNASDGEKEQGRFLVLGFDGKVPAQEINGTPLYTYKVLVLSKDVNSYMRGVVAKIVGGKGMISVPELQNVRSYFKLVQRVD